MKIRTFYQATSKFIAAIMIAMLALTALPVSPAYADDTGWVNPQSNAATYGGDNNGFESNPWDAYANGGGYAYNNNGEGDRHLYYGYNFSGIPSGATIDGIEVRLDWWVDFTTGTNDIGVELSWDGGSTWTSAQNTSGDSTSQSTSILGGSSDNWGHTWTTNELSSTNFRVRLTCNCSGYYFCGYQDFSLDWVPVRVTYTNSLPPTTTTLTSTLNPSTVGQTVTFTATVAPAVASGTVTFLDGATMLGTGTLSGGVATFGTSALAAGVHNITAVYGGDSSYAGSTSGGLVQQVNSAPSFTSATSATFTVGRANSFTVTANGYPSAFTFSSSGALPGGVALSAAGILSGTPGDGTVWTYNPVFTATNGISPDATQNFTLTVIKANASVTITSDSPDPTFVGDPVVVTYTVVPTSANALTPTGDVFISDGADSCTATVADGTCTLTLNNAGIRTLTATYGGDANFNGDTYPGRQHTVQIPYTITVSAGPGGTIQEPHGTALSGPQRFAAGSDLTFDIEPDDNYIVQNVDVDNPPDEQMINSYRFDSGSLSGDHEIAATFDGGWSLPAGSANGGGYDWSDMSDGYTSNNQRADSPGFLVPIAGNVDYYNFNIPTIPTDSTIDGIQVAIEGTTDTSNVDVSISSGSGIWSSSKTTTFTANTPEKTLVLGGPNDLWGTTWGPTSFTNANFRVRIAAGPNAQFSVDQVQVKVHYREPTTLSVIASPGTNPPNPDAVYGGTTDLVATLTTTVGGIPISGQTVNFTVNGAPVGTAVTNGSGVATLPNVSLAGIASGTYPSGVGASYAGTTAGSLPGYLGSTATNSLTISGATLTVTADDQTTIYGDPDPAFTFTYSGFLPGDDASDVDTAPTCTVTSPHVDVGTYTINCSGGVDDNYVFAYVPGTLTINPSGTLVITASSHTMPYGGVVPTITPTYTGLLVGDTEPETLPTCTTTATSASTVGTYASSCTGAADPNYTITYVDGTVEVTKTSLTVTANNKSRAYGEANPTLDATITGFVNGETLGTSDVTGLASCSTTAVPSSPVAGSPYPITCTVGTLASSNYSFAFAPGMLTITPADTLVVTASSHTMPYGGAVPTIIPSYSGLQAGDTAPATLPVCDTTATSTSSVGPYPSSCTGAADPNYGTITYVNGTVNITKATLTVTANNKTRPYGAVNPVLDTTITGFLNGETLGTSDVTGTPACSTTAVPSSPVSGSPYPITCTIGTLASNNYTFTFAPGDLTVTPVTLTITALDETKPYDKVPYSGGNGVSYSGFITGEDETTALSGSLTYSGSSQGAVNTGTYAITPGGLTADNGNYTINFVDGTLTITPLSITVTAVTDTKPYDGDTSSAGGPIITGSLAAGDTPDFIQTFDTPDIGTGKTLTPSGVVQDGNGGNNYSVTFVDDTTGVIAGITVTVTGITADNKMYDGTTDAVLNLGSATLVGVVPGDDVTLVTSGATGAFITKHVGNGKTVFVSGLTLSGADASNYGIIQPATTANITTSPITVTAQTNTKVYDSTTSSVALPQITVGTLATGDTSNFTQAYSTPTVGTSKLLVPGGEVNDGNGGGNYLVTFVNNTTGVITAQPITVTADPKTKAFGDPDPLLTYSITSGSLVGGDSLSGNLTRVAGEAVGTYAILQGSVSAGPNYNLTYVGANLTIGIVNQTITVITHAPANAAYNTSFNVAATASSGLPVAITTSGSCTGSGSTNATIIMASGTGACTVHYNQAGNANFTPALEVLETTAAQRANQTITVTTPPPASAAFNSGFNVAATASSGLPVAYSSTGVCTNSASSFTMTSGTGTCTVQYNQAGDANYNPAPQVTQTTNAQPASQTISVTTSPPSSAAYGNSFTVAATASSGLPVTYSAAGACTNVGTTFTMTGATGVCTVQYNQAGNANYSPAPQVTQNVNAVKANQTLTVTTSAPSSAANGASFNVAAAASSGLPVSISTSGFCTGSGTDTATITMTSGTGACTVLYNQPGNGIYNAAPQVSETVNSQKANQTITITQSAPATALNASSFNVAATASSGLPVSITTSGICTGGGSGSASITMTSGSGTCTVEYNQAGDANYNPAPSVNETVNAQKVDQTITVTKAAPVTASVNSYFTVAATASSGLPVIYSAAGSCTNVGDTFTMTSSLGICTVQYNQPGNTNYNAAPQVTEDVIANEGPAITSPNGANFDIGFPGAFTITTTGNPVPTITLTGILPDGVTFADNGDGTAILSGQPLSGTGGSYDLVITATNGILPDAIMNFTLNVSRGPTILTNGLGTLQDTGDGHLDEGEVVSVGVTQFLVNFSKDVNDPAGNTDPDDVTNPANYMLLGNNGDGIQTNSCASGVTGNDTVIPIGSITYNNNGGAGPFLALLNVNGGQPLADGNYRLIICGTTSIRDLAGIPLAGDGTLEGTDFIRNFVVLIATGGGSGGGGGSSSGGGGSGSGGASGASGVNTIIPVTGFAPGRITDLSGLPVTRYKALGGSYIEIPALDLRLTIVGVPMKDNTWDINWLLNNVGWLEGSAFPGYSGNSVLTSHVTLQYGQPGPFANLHKLKAGDKILVHSFGSLYVYEVKSVNQLSPSNPSIMKHEETPWLTLFTCAEYYEKGSTYLRRLVVKAALVETLADTYQSPGR